MRYVEKQPHKASCGIVAITNALKDFGVRTSYQSVYSRVSKTSYYHSGVGIFHPDILTLLGLYQFSYQSSASSMPGSIVRYRTRRGNYHLAYLDKFGELHNVPKRVGTLEKLMARSQDVSFINLINLHSSNF